MRCTVSLSHGKAGSLRMAAAGTEMMEAGLPPHLLPTPAAVAWEADLLPLLAGGGRALPSPEPLLRAVRRREPLGEGASGP